MADQEVASVLMPYNQAAQYLQLFVNAFQGATRLHEILRTAATAEAMAAEADRRCTQIHVTCDAKVVETEEKLRVLDQKYEAKAVVWQAQEQSMTEQLTALAQERASAQEHWQTQLQAHEADNAQRLLSIEKEYERRRSTLEVKYTREVTEQNARIASLQEEEANLRQRVLALQEAMKSLRSQVEGLTMVSEVL